MPSNEIVCRSFPPDLSPEIWRENLLTDIDLMFEAGHQALLIEGEEGRGKTVLLAQYVRYKQGSTVAAFLKPTTKWAYDPETLKLELANQIHWILHGTEIEEFDKVTDASLRRSLFDLQGKARRERRVFSFVIDGLDEVRERDPHVYSQLLDLIPFGLPSFQFLLSGSTSCLPDKLRQSVKPKSHFVSGFIQAETIRYLEDLKLPSSSIEEIHTTCKGVPGHLASIRRILSGGLTADELLRELPSKLPELFEIEWRTLAATEIQFRVLAAIAFSRASLRQNDIARALKVPLESVVASTQNVAFLTHDSNLGFYAFVSESFRRFAADRLQGWKNSVLDCLVTDLFQDPAGENALTYLPSYLDESGQHDRLLDYLSADHFSHTLRFSKSLGPVQQKTRLGIRTAKKLQRHDVLLRLTIQRTALIEMAKAEIWNSEIMALLALKDYDAALTLAHATVLKEARLHLLAIIAKAKREHGVAAEAELMDEIYQLIQQIDFGELKNKASEIAADLVYSKPELAIEIMEKATGTESSPNALDWMFAKASIEAQLDPTNAKRTKKDQETQQAFDSRIKNPQVKSFTSAISKLVGGYSSSEILAEIKRLASTGERLFFICRWLVSNPQNEDAPDIVQYGLKLLVGSTDYAPNATVYRQMATALPYVKDHTVLQRIIASFDGQKTNVQNDGPVEEFVRLQCTLASAEMLYNSDHGRKRFVELYFDISATQDLAIRGECLAWFLSHLVRVDPHKYLDDGDGLHTLASEELDKTVQDLLAGTAEHHLLTRGIIEALAIIDPERARKVSLSLNTPERRDKSLFVFFEAILRLENREVDWSLLHAASKDFFDPDQRDSALLLMIEKLAFLQGNESHLIYSGVLDLASQVSDATVRARAYCVVYTGLQRLDRQFGSYAETAKEQMLKSWEMINVGWEKVNAGLKITQSTAGHSIEFARAHVAETERARREMNFDVPTTANAYLASLRLTLRAYDGLIATGLNDSSTEERVRDLIDRVPSKGERAKLWAEVAISFHLKGKPEECRKIVSDYVRPFLLDVDPGDRWYHASLTISLAPALYSSHKKLALEIIQGIERCDRDRALNAICAYIISGVSPFEPYDLDRREGADIRHEEIVDLCEIMSLMEDDSDIYLFIERIVDSVVRGPNSARFTEQQKGDLIVRLTKIAEEKLPSPSGIKHNGFLIVARAQIQRLQKSKESTWRDLVENARSIPNISDRCYVLTLIANAMPQKLQREKQELAREAMKTAELIPVTYDRILRYEDIARNTSEIDSGLARACLKKGMEMAIEKDTDDFRSAQRRLIEFAYRIDRSLASSLVSLTDNDPARSASKENLKRQLTRLDLKRRMSGEDMPRPALGTRTGDYVRAARELLEGLNSGTVQPTRIAETVEYVEIAADMPFSDSFPILEWFIENAKKKLGKHEQNISQLRSLFENVIAAAELASVAASQTCSNLSRVRKNVTSTGSSSILIRSGQRESAMSFIRNWFDSSLGNYLKICDPYFGLEQLDILQDIRLRNPQCKVHIITSRKHLLDLKVPLPWEDAFRHFWRLHLSDQAPPPTDILIVGTEERGQFPIHDRWWVTENAGLRLGTSLNSLGISKESEISCLARDEAVSREEDLDRYIQRIPREHNGDRLLYNLFSL